nr:protein spaetzle-like [Nomia melanderi]
MERRYGEPILPIIKLCLLILTMTQNIHGYPHHATTTTTDVGQSAGLTGEPRITVNPALSREISEEDDDSSDSEERSADNDVSKRKGRRDTSGRSFRDLEDMQADGKIIFPEDDIPRHVPACKGSTYCEKVDSYPANLVSEAIQRNGSLKYLAGVDVLSGIVQRIDAMDDVPLCISTEQVIFPQSAENKDNQWKFIANQDNFKQGVRVEKCSNENTSCNVIGGPGEGYRTTCKQKYVYRQLAAVLSDGTMVPDTFKFPSSCCCHIMFTGSPFTRMGQVTPAKTRRRK